MRQVGTLGSAEHARRFEDYLLTKGIHSSVEREDAEWVVWIHEEDQVDGARDEFARFREDPDDAAYTSAAAQAAGLRKADERKAKQARRKVVDVRERWNRPLWAQCPVTFSLITLSVAVVIVSTHWEEGLWRLCNKAQPVLQYLFITPVFEQGDELYWYPSMGLEAIRSGQVWRLFTPMLIHFSPIHLLFNMLWLRQLGAAIEMRRGRLRFALLVLLIAGLSNWAQYAYEIPFVDSPEGLNPFFGGMSGVVFGLFGYVWMQSRFQPESGFFAPPTMVFLMMAWFFLCMTGAVGAIANVAHGGGLVTGMILGYAPKLWRDLARK